ncbi:MAG TPA: hypothetical protein VH392_06125 [Sphingomicrobium sp.]|jgi:hypothetical protein
MIAALLLAAAAPSAIDAEHAFARDAQRIGQWTAFRKYAAEDAVIFTPQAAWARESLPQKDPPKAIRWAPAHSWVSCDGRTAVNTGPWWKADGTLGGYFTTVWQRSGGRWQWVYDGGGPMTGDPPSTSKPKTHRATCGRKAPGAPVVPPPPLTRRQARTTPEDDGRGESADKTLGWDWKVEKDGSRHFRVFQWTGLRYAQVLFNDVPAPESPRK